MNLMLLIECFLNLKCVNCVGKVFNIEGDFSGVKNEVKLFVNFFINLYEFFCFVNYFFM